MYCKTCGQSNPDWSNYCIHDGTALVSTDSSQKMKLMNKETNFCPGCGEKTDGSDNYCMSCGFSLLKLTAVEDEAKTVKPVQKPWPNGERASFSFSPDLMIRSLKKAIAPAMIAFVLMLVFSYLLTSFVTSSYDELFEETFEATPEEIFAQIADEFDANIKAPKNITGFTDTVMASHLITPSFGLDMTANIFREDIRISGKLDITVKNVLYLLIPLIALVAAGIFYRRKNTEVSLRALLTGAISMGLIYALLLTIFSFFSGFDYKLNLADAGESVSLKFATTYSFLLAFIKGLLIGTVFSLLGMLFSINYRRVTKHLEGLMPFGAAVHQGFAAFIRGFITVFVIVLIVMGTKLKELKENLYWWDIPGLEQVLEKSSSAVAFIGAEVASFIYSMLHFSPLSFEMSEGGYRGESGGIEYSIFSGLKEHGAAEGEFPELEYFINAYDIGLLLKLALFIPIIFLLFAGYRMALGNQASYQSLAVFSLVYSIFTALLASIASIAIDGEMRMFREGTESISIILAVSVFKVFMGSFILSYIAGFAGSYLSQFIPNRRS